MRMMFAIVLALGLSGCSNTDFFGDSASDAPTTSSASEQQTAPAQPAPVQSAAAAQPTAAAPPAAPQGDTDTTVAEQTQVQVQPAPVAQASASPSVHCTTLAKQRAQDAAFQGEDADTQESVYNRTYSDCVAWDLKHAFR